MAIEEASYYQWNRIKTEIVQSMWAIDLLKRVIEWERYVLINVLDTLE